MTVLVSFNEEAENEVKLSFFGEIDFGRFGEPSVTNDGAICVASMIDLLATKLKVILQRAEAKDYRDITVILEAGVNLAHGLVVAKSMFAPTFQPSESLRALTYFEDGDLKTLSDKEKHHLVEAVSRIRREDLEEIPIPLSRKLSLI